ncbi:hypothetical protein AB6A40_007783 [Gnathostoma spinigerum]|uniref:ANK_REP_REGION domain-containing protein n=1 Tax=Gnathostoma spinigerum TaxID=75299 RepID=A0ABD6EM98_9BILA
MSHYFAVYVPSPENPHGAVFNSLKDASKFANSPESKQFGARFKGFASPVDADQFAQHGDLHSLNSLCSLMKSCDTAVSTAGEPTVPYPSVSRVQLNRFKRAIETKADSTFDSLVDSNPRFLINIGADTATILAEGFRYNALHVAARVGNAYVVRRVLSLVTDSSFLISTYGRLLVFITCCVHLCFFFCVSRFICFRSNSYLHYALLIPTLLSIFFLQDCIVLLRSR